MLYDLLHYDISDVDLTKFPRNAALLDQILNSMPPEQKFWYDRLMTGTLSDDEDEWTGNIETKVFYKDYLEFAKSLGHGYNMPITQFGKAIKTLCLKVDRKKKKCEFGDRRKPHYIFPPLAECRKMFEEIVKTKVDWSEDL